MGILGERNLVQAYTGPLTQSCYGWGKLIFLSSCFPDWYLVPQESSVLSFGWKLRARELANYLGEFKYGWRWGSLGPLWLITHSEESHSWHRDFHLITVSYGGSIVHPCKSSNTIFKNCIFLIRLQSRFPWWLFMHSKVWFTHLFLFSIF